MSKQVRDTSTQKTITLSAGVVAPLWTLALPLNLTLATDEDGWNVLTDDVFQVYGDGETLEDARCDYIASLIEYYRMVERDATDGDESAHSEFDRMRSYLRPVAR